MQIMHACKNFVISLGLQKGAGSETFSENHQISLILLESCEFSMNFNGFSLKFIQEFNDFLMQNHANVHSIKEKPRDSQQAAEFSEQFLENFSIRPLLFHKFSERLAQSFDYYYINSLAVIKKMRFSLQVLSDFSRYCTVSCERPLHLLKLSQ